MQEDRENEFTMLYSAKVELDQVVPERERDLIETAILDLAETKTTKSAIALEDNPGCYYIDAGDRHLVLYHVDVSMHNLTILGVLERKVHTVH